MPGAWEQIQPTVLVSILTRGMVSTVWAESLRNLILPPRSSVVYHSGMPFDHARNAAVETMLEKGFEWLMFLDDDVLVPPDVISRLMAPDQPIVSGLYCRRADPIRPVMLKIINDQLTWITDIAVDGLIEVDMVGCGCLLIHRGVFERMPRPWFNWRIDRVDLPVEQRLSEDFAFCQDAKKLEIPIFIDTTIRCQHVGLGFSDPHTYQFRPSTL